MTLTIIVSCVFVYIVVDLQDGQSLGLSGHFKNICFIIIYLLCVSIYVYMYLLYSYCIYVYWTCGEAAILSLILALALSCRSKSPLLLVHIDTAELQLLLLLEQLLLFLFILSLLVRELQRPTFEIRDIHHFRDGIFARLSISMPRQNELEHDTSRGSIWRLRVLRVDQNIRDHDGGN